MQCSLECNVLLNGMLWNVVLNAMFCSCSLLFYSIRVPIPNFCSCSLLIYSIRVPIPPFL